MTKKSLPRLYKKLLSDAKKAKRFSYSPYSRFRVGASILTVTGKTYTGCNIENSSYGLTLCAERTAIFKAVSEGEKSFRAMAVVSDNKSFTPPCGACRQVLMDLAPDIDFIMTDHRSAWKIVKLRDLLPLPFQPKDLHRAHRKH